MSAALAEQVAPPVLAIGAQIDAIYDLKQRKRELEEKAVDLQRIIDAKEIVLQAALEAQGVGGAKGGKARADIRESVVPQVENWDLYYAFIRRNNAFELLERRPAVTAWREHAERRREKTVPGTVPFTKRKVQIVKVP